MQSPPLQLFLSSNLSMTHLSRRWLLTRSRVLQRRMPRMQQRKIPRPVMQGLRTRVQLKALVPKVMVPKVKLQRQQSRPLLLALLTRGRLLQFLQRLRLLLRQVPKHPSRN
jgi:hypothetical protein